MKRDYSTTSSNRPGLEEVDVAIFGGGLCGLGAAFAVAAEGKKVLIVERRASLAWEATALCHGAAEASRALATSMLLFGLDEHVAWDDVVPAGGERPAPDIPTAVISGEPLVDGLPVFRLFAEAGLAGSGKQAKNLAQQGGAYVNGVARQAFDKVTRADLRDDGTLLLRAGKKKYCLVSLG